MKRNRNFEGDMRGNRPLMRGVCHTTPISTMLRQRDRLVYKLSFETIE